jgi:DNA-binding phage protein
MYTLNVKKLREKLREHGDTSGHKVQKRTGINASTVYRVLREATQPDLITALRLSIVYDFDLREVMDDTETAA